MAHAKCGYRVLDRVALLYLRMNLTQRKEDFETIGLDFELTE